MDDDSGYEVIEELPEEEPVPQIDDVHDTAPMDVPMRAGTFSEWPPEPPLPAEADLAVGTISEGVPPPRQVIEVVVPRNARIFAAVRRPTTSSDTDD